MKFYFVFSFLLLYVVTNATPDSLPKKKVFYKMELQEVSGKYKYGYLSNITEEDVFYSNDKIRFGSVNSTDGKINYTNISQLRLKRKGAVGRSALIGAAIGAGIGVIAGLVEGDDKYVYVNPAEDFLGIGSAFINAFRYSAAQKATIYGLSLGSGGAIVGAVIGALAHKKFIIGGNREKHNAMKINILEKVSGVSQAKAN